MIYICLRFVIQEDLLVFAVFQLECDPGIPSRKYSPAGSEFEEVRGE